MDPVIIAISGGSGSGKTTLANKIKEIFGSKCEILSQDHYYHDQSSNFDGDGGSINFDHPSSIDFNLFLEHLKLFKERKQFEVPNYDFATHKRLKSHTSIQPLPILIAEGTLILSQNKLLPCLNEKIFVDTPEALRFERRLKRDMLERGRSKEGVTKQFNLHVKPMHDKYVEPSIINANIVIHNNNYTLCIENLRKKYF